MRRDASLWMIFAWGFGTGRTLKKIFLKKSHQLKIFFSSSPVSSRLREHCRSQTTKSTRRHCSPGLSLNSTCGTGHTPALKATASTPRLHCLSSGWDALVPLSYGVPPPGIACGVSACAPLPHAIETVLPFHSSSHPASFPSRVSSAMSIIGVHTEIPARNSSTNYFYRTSR